MNQHQHDIINYLIEENRVLRQQIGDRRLRFNDGQRRRLAAKAKKLSRRILAQVATIVTPETLAFGDAASRLWLRPLDKATAIEEDRCLRNT